MGKEVPEPEPLGGVWWEDINEDHQSIKPLKIESVVSGAGGTTIYSYQVTSSLIRKQKAITTHQKKKKNAKEIKEKDITKENPVRRKLSLSSHPTSTRGISQKRGRAGYGRREAYRGKEAHVLQASSLAPAEGDCGAEWEKKEALKQMRQE